MESIEIANSEIDKSKDYKIALIEAEKQMNEIEKKEKNDKNQPLLPPPIINPLLEGKSPSGKNKNINNNEKKIFDYNISISISIFNFFFFFQNIY